MPFAFKHYDKILAAADFIVASQSPRGVYNAGDSRAGNNTIYCVKGAFTVLQAAWIVRDSAARLRDYASSIDRLLAALAEVQLSDGSLPLFSGLEVPAEAEAGDPLFTTGFVNPTAGLAVVAREYGDLTDDEKHRPSAERALDYLIDVFTPQRGFRTATNENKLNSSDGFPLYALHAWADYRPDAAGLIDPATEYIVHGELWNAEEKCWKFGFGIQDGFALEEVSHPTLDFTRMWALFMIHGERFAEPIHQSIVASQRNFARLESFYNRGGTFADVRIRTALPAVMALFDHHTKSATFTDTDTFHAMVRWTLNMFDPAIAAFREQEDLVTGKKSFSGIPAQFLAQYLFACGIVNRNVPNGVR